MNHFAHERPFGAELIADESTREGRARFRIWAPKLQQLTLEFENAPAQSMPRSEDGWFQLECDTCAGTNYRYRIDDKLSIPDPASRLQKDDVHGWSVLLDPRDYTWQQPQWRGRPWHEIVIYELHVGCYGGFSGVEQQLQQLAQLGITAIELMPIADFSGRRNWGYDGVLPFAPDTAYGSPTQLKQLIDSAHALGLCVYLDVVYNHFGPDGNYLHCYAPDFFKADTSSPWGDSIDFSRPNVREFFTQNALYWLHEYRFDGLRLDAVHAISDPSWLDEMAARVRASTEPGRHIHLMLENEHNCATHLDHDLFNAQWNDDWHNVMHVLLTGESEGYYANYCENSEQKLARSLAEGFIYQGEPSPTHANRPRGEPSAFLPPTAFINFLQNHDQIGNRAFGDRLTTLADEDDLRAATTLQLLMPAIPLLFMGEPWQVDTPFLFFTDFHGDLARAVREGRSNEFAAFTAFKNEQQRARIPDPNAPDTFNNSIPSCTEENCIEEKSVTKKTALAFYRELLEFRHRYIIPRLDGCRAIAAKVIGKSAVIASWQFSDDTQLLIAINFSETPYAIDPLIAPLLLENKGLFESRTSVGDLAIEGMLAPHCAVASLNTRIDVSLNENTAVSLNESTVVSLDESTTG